MIWGFWDLVRFWDFSKDFLGFLMKCTKSFRVIYPSFQTSRIDTKYSKAAIYHIKSTLFFVTENGISQLCFCTFPSSKADSLRLRPFARTIVYRDNP